VSPIRVLVVDDSATMRGLITAALRRDPDIDVVGSAGDPLEARTAIKALNPDVITLDIEMPNMNGLEFLEKIMRLRPMPVVMVSTLTLAGAEETIRALELGAIDCIAKPSTATVEGFSDLVTKVKMASKARIRSAPAAPVARKPVSDYRPGNVVLGIGASTGGVEALLSVIQHFPANCPGTIITQHMPANFTASFAARLDRATDAQVAEAYDGAVIEHGKVWLAPGGIAHLEAVSSGGRLVCRLRSDETVSGHRPSVDVMFNSLAKAVGKRGVGAILTGMGKDGADGLLAMRTAGARTLGQDSDSCVVYGMPRVAHEIGGVERQYSIGAIGPAILELCRFGA
jgi:two-component system chemotaxis response regulator CheB